MVRARLWIGIALCPALLLLCGCGDPTADVSGKISYGGQPVKGGSVTFISGKGTVSTSINEDGSYKASKVPSGEVTICVDTEALNPAKRSKAPSYGPPPGQSAPEGMIRNEGEANAKRYVKIPEKYSKPDATDLKTTLGSGSVEHNIELR